MRLWTIHPKYLDVKGLTAMWREGLLARAVLLGRTKGYRNHPQLHRFRDQADPLHGLDALLTAVLDESLARGYRYDATKIERVEAPGLIIETSGQLAFEREHLLAKLWVRDPDRARILEKIADPDPNPVFRITDGEVRDWEKGLR